MSVILFVLSWFFLLVSVMFHPSIDIATNNLPLSATNAPTLVKQSETNSLDLTSVNQADSIVEPKRYKYLENVFPPPPISEIEKNMTLYLHTIHKRLGDLAGVSVTAEVVWDTYLDITKSMVMKWDDENKYRLPKQKSDDSIYVALGRMI